MWYLKVQSLQTKWLSTETEQSIICVRYVCFSTFFSKLHFGTKLGTLDISSCSGTVLTIVEFTAEILYLYLY